MIDSTAFERVATSVPPPVALLRVRLTVFVPSASVFCSDCTVKVRVRTLVAVPPAGKLSVPALGL